MSAVILDPQKVSLTLSSLKDELSALKVSSLYLFGSRPGRNAIPPRDVDFLADFSERGVSIFDIVNLQLFLEKTFKCRVGVGPRESLREKFQDKILREMVRVA